MGETRARTLAGKDRGGGSAKESGRGIVVLVIGAIAATVAFGVWGLLAPRAEGDHVHTSGVGVPVDFEGGTLTVQAVRDVDLSLPMTGPGMQMGPTSGVPDIPDGYRWVDVEVTVRTTAQAPYEIDPDAFVVAADHESPVGPVSVDQAGSTVPSAGELTRSFFYEVPAETSELELWAPGADEPLALPLGEAPPPHDH